MTIDVEDAVNQAMRNFFSEDIAPTIRVYDNTMRLLDLFAEYDTKATFFILGEVAKTHPELVKEIAGSGHEVGIHGYSHTRYDMLSRKKIRDEIIESKKLVEDVSGMQVLGHRAPEFSISHKNIWVMDILLDAGIKYDSSIFPAVSRRYGWLGFNKNIDWYTLEDNRKIIEAPLSSINCFGKAIPVCGGGYLRIFPYSFTDNAFKKVLKDRPVNVYMHPYEIDIPPFQQFYMDAVKKTSFKKKLQLQAYWYNRNSVIPKLKKLLNTYKFNTLSNIIKTTLNIEFL